MITLRPVELTDLDTFYKHQADPVSAQMSVSEIRGYDEHRAVWTNRILVNPVGIVRTVVVDGAVAGNILSWKDDEGRRFLGYRYGQQFWGRGIATEALRLFAAEVEERPLYASVVTTNVGSRRVLEKAGFEHIGEQVAEDGLTELVFRLD